jgi:hypothetical protein
MIGWAILMFPFVLLHEGLHAVFILLALFGKNLRLERCHVFDGDGESRFCFGFTLITDEDKITTFQALLRMVMLASPLIGLPLIAYLYLHTDMFPLRLYLMLGILWMIPYQDDRLGFQRQLELLKKQHSSR